MIEWADEVLAELLDETRLLSLGELCRACSAPAETVVALVEQGLIEPRETGPGQWRFEAVALGRVRTALRLQADLGLNPAGAVLAVELLEEIERLRRRLRRLEGSR